MVAMTAASRRDAAWLAFALALLLAWDASGLDLLLVRAVGSPEGFEWREHWLTARVLHDGARVAGWAALAAVIGWPGLAWRTRAWWIGTTLLCAASISLLKHASATSCPWSLAEFGGTAQYVSHWQWGRADGGDGQCFPSGHAATAFALLPGVHALSGRAARRFLLAVLGAGAAFGLAQMLRGAHYASHTLWTAWLCWMLTSASHHVREGLHSMRRQAAQAAGA